MINWDTTTEEFHLIDAIVRRANSIHRVSDTFSLMMDITAVHLNDCKLNLELLLSFDLANFSHDVFGIRKYIDRDTGKLTQCFVPRCALKYDQPNKLSAQN